MEPLTSSIGEITSEEFWELIKGAAFGFCLCGALYSLLGWPSNRWVPGAAFGVLIANTLFAIVFFYT